MAILWQPLLFVYKRGNMMPAPKRLCARMSMKQDTHGMNLLDIKLESEVKTAFTFDDSKESLWTFTLTPEDGGVYLVTSAPLCDGSDSTIQAWDMTTEKCLASFEIRKEDIVMQWRSIEQGRAAMFLIRDGLLSTDNGPQHYHLLRLDFTEGVHCSTQARFWHNSSVVQELPPADISLSEDLVVVLAVDTDNTVVIFLLQWRTGTTASIKTCLSPPDEPYFTILSPNAISIWVNSASSPYTYTYSLSEIYPHFSKCPQSPKCVPNPSRVDLHHTTNASPYHLANVTYLYCETSRKAASDIEDLIAQPLSILHLGTQKDEGGRILTCLSHEYRSTEFSAKPTRRLCFAPVNTPFKTYTVDGGEQVWPIGTSDSEAIVFPERLASGKLQMSLIVIPADDSEARQQDPQWCTDNLTHSLEIPEELDLERVDMMTLVTTGTNFTLAVAVDGGDIFILEY
ncbi:hypothetical protein BU17DRAFT_71190 [Hysterangium stoloniferum]|nr:hypothetical protein BU17DRAFT_71190 [Hysterangium stoloniferum]